MRAMVIEEFGGPEVFSEQDIERPRPGPKELLIRVVASGTNPVDAKMRADGSKRGVKLPAVLGADASGVVEEIGPGCTDFRPVTRSTTVRSCRARTPEPTPSTTSSRKTSSPPCRAG